MPPLTLHAEYFCVLMWNILIRQIQAAIQLFIHQFGYPPQFLMAGCGSFLATLVHPFRMFILLNDKVPVNLRVTLLLRVC